MRETLPRFWLGIETFIGKGKNEWHSSGTLRSSFTDQEKSAKFYEEAFGLKRAGREDLGWSSAIYLSDGVVNLALLHFTGEKGSGRTDMKNFAGAHHFGFIVDDIAEAQKKVEAAGGTFFMDLGDNAEKENFERKFKDPDGIIIDISRKGWSGTDSRGTS